MGVYLVGIPLQGSPSALRTPFIVRTSLSFVRHCRSVLCSSLYVLRTLSSIVHTLLYAVRLHLYVVIVHMLSLFGPSYVVVHCSLSFVCCCMSFVRHHTPFVFVRMSSYIVRRPCGNVPRNILENSLLVKDKKDERYKKTRLGPKQLLSLFGPTFLPVD
jgi:hypothetical protein